MAHSISPMTQTLLCNFSLQLLEVLAQGCNSESFFWGLVDRTPVLSFLIWNIFLQMIGEHTLQCTRSWNRIICRHSWLVSVCTVLAFINASSFLCSTLLRSRTYLPGIFLKTELDVFHSCVLSKSFSVFPLLLSLFEVKWSGSCNFF